MTGMASTLRLSLICFGLALATSCASSVATPPASPGDTNLRTDEGTLLHVDDATVLIATSFPAQVSVQVKGSLPDPCSAVGTVTQRREGNKVIVSIPVRRGTGVCAQVIQATTVSVRLEGSFESGSYIVVINGVERPFKI
jgi:hypothetical protein